MWENQKIHFIFVWRLVEEKWFDLVLSILDNISQDDALKDKFHIDIFGDGPLRKYIPKYTFVSYHGFQSKEKILKTRKGCHYLLMPSTFLETFGLSALDSLRVWVPVIGYQKWWLDQFILEELAINQWNFEEYIFNIIRNFTQKTREKQSRKSRKMFEHYTKEKWIDRFQKLSWLNPWAKILLVSDYIVRIWGIESYLFHVKSLLEEYWYLVMLIWCEDQRVIHNRLISMFGVFWNIKWARLFKNIIQKFQPDLVRWHSIHRWFGPLVLYEAKHCRAPQRVMYHDFWLFHPYPSKVHEEGQMYHTNTLKGYMKEWIYIKRRQFPLQYLKRISSFLIKRQLKKIIDLHLIPSLYMKKIIAKQYQWAHIHIEVLPHFV